MENFSEDSTENPKPTNFESFLPWACKNYNIFPEVIVTKVGQPKYLNAPVLKRKPSRKLIHSKVGMSLMRLLDSTDDKESSLEIPVNTENVIMIQSLYDINEDLVQLKFLKNKTIPQKLMKVFALTIPYHKYLTSITINSGLHMETLYEISKFLPNSNITELCLDSTVLSQANYSILLTHGKLKHLSLAKCSINDAVVKTITDELGDGSPASFVLSALNLSSNRITDVGAKYVAGILRTNRKLCYLNLAGNMITDKGGTSILDTLQKFSLEAKELSESRARYVAFLKEKNELANTLFIELQTAKQDRIAKKKSAKPQQNVAHKPVTETENEIRLSQEKAANLAETKMGSFDHHYSLNNTETQDGVVRCLGNNTLCCLNLAYNKLTYFSVKKLRDVLVTQTRLNRTPRGLVKVVIQGNSMPVACKEYDEINRLIESRLVGTRRRIETLPKRKAQSSVTMFY